jgi:hypothetical protein
VPAANPGPALVAPAVAEKWPGLRENTRKQLKFDQAGTTLGYGKFAGF